MLVDASLTMLFLLQKISDLWSDLDGAFFADITLIKVVLLMAFSFYSPGLTAMFEVFFEGHSILA